MNFLLVSFTTISLNMSSVDFLYTLRCIYMYMCTPLNDYCSEAIPLKLKFNVGVTYIVT